MTPWYDYGALEVPPYLCNVCPLVSPPAWKLQDYFIVLLVSDRVTVLQHSLHVVVDELFGVDAVLVGSSTDVNRVKVIMVILRTP